MCARAVVDGHDVSFLVEEEVADGGLEVGVVELVEDPEEVEYGEADADDEHVVGGGDERAFVDGVGG